MSKFRRYSRHRRFTATFKRHNGDVDDHGNPTRSVAEDWEYLPNRYPCEVIAGSGGERIRGRQVTESATHVMFGDFVSLQGVEPQDRLILNDGREFDVVYVSDQGGFDVEGRVECRYEK